MKPNELRIGNWVNYEQTWHRVTGITNEGKINSRWWKQDPFEEDYVCHIDNLLPIELTPEILEKCGFRRGRSNQYWVYLNTQDRSLDVSIYSSGIYPTIVQDSEISNGECNVVSLNKIEYLHQLQNLYFALTGEELEVKISNVKDEIIDFIKHVPIPGYNIIKEEIDFTNINEALKNFPYKKELRLAISGQLNGIGLAEMIVILGRDEVIRRVRSEKYIK